MERVLLGVLLAAAIVFAEGPKVILRDNFDAEKGDAAVPGRTGKAILAKPGARGKTLPLPKGLDLSKGAVSFWMQSQEELRCFDEPRNIPLVVAQKKEALEISLFSKTAAELRFTIRTGKKNPPSARFDFTHLKPKKWYHAVLSWDAAQGAMDIFLSGSHCTHVDAEPWQMPDPGAALLIGGPGIAIDDFTLYDRHLAEHEVPGLVEVPPESQLADEGVQVFNQTIADYPVKKELLYENGFDGDLTDWVLEGPGVTKVVDGRLYMESTDPEKGHIVLWNKKDFPADFLAEWDFSPANDSALYIIFFCAKGRNGKDLFDPSLAKRDGTFIQYTMGDINAYHISYFRNIGVRSGICNMRKEHGFYLVTIGRDPIPPVTGGKYHIVLLKKGPQMRFFIDNKLVISFDDDGKTYGPVWGEGKIGLRQMAPSKAYYDNFRVYKLLE